MSERSVVVGREAPLLLVWWGRHVPQWAASPDKITKAEVSVKLQVF